MTAIGAAAYASTGQGAAHAGPNAAVPSTGAAVSGTVSYRARVALPPTAVVEVQLADVSRADAAAVVLGEQTVETRGKQVPFAFEIPYDPAKIEPSQMYAVQARIEVDGQLRFISDQRYPVITRGAPTEVDVLVRPVGRQP